MPGTNAAGQNYQALFERSDIAVAIICGSSPLHFVSASKGFFEKTGLHRSTLIGRKLDEVFAPDSCPALGEAISRCLTTLAPVRSRIELVDREPRRGLNLSVHLAHGFPGHVIIMLEGGLLSLQAEARRSTPFHLPQSPHAQSLIFLHHSKSGKARYADNGLAGRMGLMCEGPQRFQIFEDKIHFDDRPTWERALARLDPPVGEDVATSTVRLADTHTGWLLAHIRSKVLRRDRAGAASLVLGTATDITDYAAAAIDAAGLAAPQVEEDERVRVGRELHDSTSQYLVAADLGVARVLRNSNLSAEDREHLLDVQEQLVCAKGEIRSFAHFLHPAGLREFGLRRTLEKFCAGFARRSGLHIKFNASGQLDDVPPDVEHAVFRVGQESLMNVHRHASAQEVDVALTLRDNFLTLEVRDDGVGIASFNPLTHKGIGMTILRSRMYGIGGEVNLHPLSPGLAVVARVPLLSDQDGAARVRS